MKKPHYKKFAVLVQTAARLPCLGTRWLKIPAVLHS